MGVVIWEHIHSNAICTIFKSCEMICQMGCTLHHWLLQKSFFSASVKALFISARTAVTTASMSMAGAFSPSSVMVLSSLSLVSTALITGLAWGQSFATCPLCLHQKQSPFFMNSSWWHMHAWSMSIGPGLVWLGSKSEWVRGWLMGLCVPGRGSVLCWWLVVGDDRN